MQYIWFHVYFEIALLRPACTSMTSLDTLFYTRTIACARHLASFYALIVLLSDNPEPACPDLGVWDKVDPSAEDQAFFVEQVERQ